MTDPASLTLGIVGVVLPAIELSRNVRSVFREIKNAPEQIERLEHKIQISRDILRTLQPTSESYDDQSRRLIQSLHDDYRTSLDHLENIIKESVSKSKWKGRYKLVSSQKEIQKIEDLVKELEGRINLIVSVSMWNKSLQIENSPQPQPQSQSLVADDDSSKSLHPTSRARESGRRRDCSVRHCSCSCHQASSVNRRFWRITYSPLWSLFQQCDRPTCTARRYQISFWVALSQLGIPLAVAVDLAVIAKTGTWAIVPCLRVRKVQRFTSRGFEILWRYKTKQMDWPEAKQAFIDFYRRNPDMGTHVDPDGVSYLEKLIESPWYPWSEKFQLKLLELFCKDFNVLSELEVSSTFMRTCLKWAFYDSRLTVMSELLRLGFDPNIIALPAKVFEFGLPYNFVGLFSIFSSSDPEFGGTTPLHLSIIENDRERFEKASLNESCLENNTNILGQSPLHIAVHYPTYLSLLLSKGHLVNITDKLGRTPLDYAIEGNQIDSSLLLIDAGADIRKTLQYHHMSTPCTYAALNLHIAIVQRLSIRQMHEEANKFWHETIIWALESPFLRRPERVTLLREILHLQKDPTCSSLRWARKETNLFCYIKYKEEGHLLLHYDFAGINLESPLGLPLLKSVIKNPHATECLLDNGTDVNYQDSRGKTALMSLSKIFRPYSCSSPRLWGQSNIVTLRNMLMAGADTRITDKCYCACTPQGCTAVDMLSDPLNRFQLFGCILWLTTIEEYKENEEVKHNLLVFFRRKLFTKLRIHHICCHSSYNHYDNKKDLYEHRQYSSMLDRRMAHLKMRPYHELKGLLSQYVAQSVIKLRRSNVKPIHAIDYHNDKFIDDFTFTPLVSDWKDDIKSFKECAQKDYQQRISETPENEHERIHKWYKSLTDWVDQVRTMATKFEEQGGQFHMEDDLEMDIDFDANDDLRVNTALPILAVIAGSIYSILATNLFQSG